MTLGRLLGLRSRPWASVSLDLWPGAEAQACSVGSNASAGRVIAALVEHRQARGCQRATAAQRGSTTPHLVLGTPFGQRPHRLSETNVVANYVRSKLRCEHT